MRRVRHLAVLLTAAALFGSACSGSDDKGGTTDPGDGGPGATVTLSASEKSAVAAGLSALATRVAATDAPTREFLNALGAAVQIATTATAVDVTTNLDVLGGSSAAAASATSAASSGGALVSRRVLGYSLTLRSTQPGQRTIRGGIVWDAAGLKVIVTVFGNPNILSVTYPSAGNTAYLIGGTSQVWSATAGNAAWTLINGNSAQCAQPFPTAVSNCGYEDGTVPFTVSASEPASFSGNTASGSRTAALGATRVRVLFLGVQCGVAGGPC
jgi:hypothetical protein